AGLSIHGVYLRLEHPSSWSAAVAERVGDVQGLPSAPGAGGVQPGRDHCRDEGGENCKSRRPIIRAPHVETAAAKDGRLDLAFELQRVEIVITTIEERDRAPHKKPDQR